MFIHSGKSNTTSKPLQHKPQELQFQDSMYRHGIGNIAKVKTKIQTTDSYKPNLAQVHDSCFLEDSSSHNVLYFGQDPEAF